ncbi:MAG: RNA polymerase sigma factor [Polyangia bacterium]|jgi:RNA polymerase sigma-70 factor (ECF subfamily)|nr:RNA polymerase sigma factor [Polyangia bacterium]
MAADRLKLVGPTPDLLLTQAVGSGDPQATRVLAERLFDRMRATVHYLCGGDRDADDLSQLALVEVLRSAHGFRGDCPLERWADRIAVRTALRELRRRRWREKIVNLSDDPVPADRAAPDERIFRRFLRRRLAGLLAKLTEDRRAAVMLHWVHGYSVAEIAEITESPVNTVRDRLQVAKRQLRTLINKDPGLSEWAQSVLHDNEP